MEKMKNKFLYIILLILGCSMFYYSCASIPNESGKESWFDMPITNTVSNIFDISWANKEGLIIPDTSIINNEEYKFLQSDISDIIQEKNNQIKKYKLINYNIKMTMDDLEQRINNSKLSISPRTIENNYRLAQNKLMYDIEHIFNYNQYKIYKKLVKRGVQENKIIKRLNLSTEQILKINDINKKALQIAQPSYQITNIFSTFNEQELKEQLIQIIDLQSELLLLQNKINIIQSHNKYSDGLRREIKWIQSQLLVADAYSEKMKLQKNINDLNAVIKRLSVLNRDLTHYKMNTEELAVVEDYYKYVKYNYTILIILYNDIVNSINKLKWKTNNSSTSELNSLLSLFDEIKPKINDIKRRCTQKGIF